MFVEVFLFLIINLFLALLRLRGRLQAVCSGREWGLLFTALLGLLISVACPAAEHRLWARGLQELQHVRSAAARDVRSSWTRDRSRVPPPHWQADS